MPDRAYTVTIMVSRTIVIEHTGEELSQDTSGPAAGNVDAWRRLYEATESDASRFIEDIRENITGVERDVDYEMEYGIGEHAEQPANVFDAAVAEANKCEDPLEGL